MKNIDSWKELHSSGIQMDTVDIQIKREWTKENELRIWSYGDVKAVVRRGKFSSVLPEVPIGSLITQGQIVNDVYVWDDPFWSYKFGKSCVLNNDAKPYQLFIKGDRNSIHPMNTEKMLISQLAMKRVFERLNIPVEFFTDADVYLLPSRDKFACGYSRVSYKDYEKRHLPNPDMIRYEVGWMTFYMDHDLFQEILPPEEYNRTNSHDPNHAGIDGIENKYPDFDREDFITKWIEEICKILEDSVTETVELTFK